MQGVLGLLLIVLGVVLLYDVLAGKSSNIVGLLNGNVETATPSIDKTGN